MYLLDGEKANIILCQMIIDYRDKANIFLVVILLLIYFITQSIISAPSNVLDNYKLS